MTLSRRHLIASAALYAVAPRAGLAATPRQLGWDELIPPGVPYSEIIGEGEIDEANDRWLPQFDEHGTKLNQSLDNAYVKLPGYIIPLEFKGEGVTQFVMVPYVGACIHTPPPPPNQLVFVDTKTPWGSDRLWDAVWVTGQMRHQLQSTAVAATGYALQADLIEAYIW